MTDADDLAGWLRDTLDRVVQQARAAMHSSQPAAELRAAREPLDVTKASAVSAIVDRVVAKHMDEATVGAAKFSSII